jgi:tetratricopeptide (TPR) repeat protein
VILHGRGPFSGLEACRLLGPSQSKSGPHGKCRASTILALGQLRDAEESYERAILAKPDYAEALCNRGVALAALGRDHEALASYDRALAVAPDFSEAMSNRGNALKALGRLDNAMAHWKGRANRVRHDSSLLRGVASPDIVDAG